MAEFVAVDVEPGPASEDGVSMRWRCAAPVRAVTAIAYESDDGVAGIWRVHGVDDPNGLARTAARAALVEDSSDGIVWLIFGGTHGIVLEHGSGARERQPYLLLSGTTDIT